MRNWPEISVELGKAHERLAGNRVGIGGRPMRDWPEIGVELGEVHERLAGNRCGIGESP